MRPFFMAVGILAWPWAIAVMWIFGENGGALTVIAAGVFAVVAVVSLACERILKCLEEIQQGLPQRARRRPLAARSSTLTVQPLPEIPNRPATTHF